MAVDYNKDAQAIKHAVGGKDNVTRMFHCATRLRFYPKNKNLVDEDALNNIDIVKGVNWQGAQLQVIIGNDVGDIYDALCKIGMPNDDTDSNENAPAVNTDENLWNRIIDAITGCMTPLIPALTASGMIKVVLTLLTTFHVVSQTSMSYQIVSLIGDACFYFLPVLISVNAAKVFHVDHSLAMIIACIFESPVFIKLVTGKAPVALFGIPIFKYDYTYSVIPIILMVWLMSYITKFVKKITPEILKIIMEPTLIILISAPLALIVVGPIGGWLGNGLGTIVNFLSAKLGFILVGLLAGLFPFIVITGMHHTLTPIGLNAVATGGDTLIWVSQVCSNVAEGAATLAVALKTKDKKMKTLASAAGISALLGITEPALYGVTLKLKKPLYAACIGAAIGGVFGGLLQVTMYIPQNCLLAIPAFIGKKGMMNLAYGCIMILISFVATFIITLIFGFEDNDRKGNKPAVATAGAGNAAVNTTSTTPTSSQAKISDVKLVKPTTIDSPVSGKVESIADVPDDIFAKKMMGDGVAINPEDDKVYAPMNGTIVKVADTLHAITFLTDQGTQLIIHIGLDTVNLKGQYFTSHVKDGQHVNKGDLLLNFDSKNIKKAGYNMIIPIVVLNTNDYDKIEPQNLGSEIEHGSKILELS